jgi:hypothetical protein
MSTVRFAGFSRTAGVLRFRTANEPSRAQALAKLGDTDIDMIILPTELTKNEAAKFVLTNLDRYTVDRAEAEALLTGLIKDENPFAGNKKPRVPAKSKPARAPKKTVTATNLIIKSVEDDAPLSPKQAAKVRAEFMKKLKIAYEAN